MARRQRDAETAQTAKKAVTPTRRRVISPRIPRTELAEQSPAAAPTVRHLKVASPAAKDPVQERVERLEQGVRVLAETFRRAFGEIQGSIDQLRVEVARSATQADVERALGRAATPADVLEATAQAIQPLVTGIERLKRQTPLASPALQEAMLRLMEGIDSAEAVVQRALHEQAQEHPNGDAQDGSDTSGSTEDRPDASAIWGDDSANGAGDLAVAEHGQYHGSRRRPGWPGRAYANWKYRRSELT